MHTRSAASSRTPSNQKTAPRPLARVERAHTPAHSRAVVPVPRSKPGDAAMDAIFQVSTDAVSRRVAHLVTDEEAHDGRTIAVDGKRLLNFGSCSYLGLEHDPDLISATRDAAERYGTQFSSSRSYLSIGQYQTLEELLERIFGKPVIATPSTTLGHMSALPVLVNSGDAVILDQQVHHSVQTAAQLLKARGIPVHIVRHNRLDKLEQLVTRLEAKHEAVWYMADGVYSMYGDVAPLAELEAMLNRHRRMWLYVDDAHGMGWTGEQGQGYVRSQIGHHERMVEAASLNKSFAAGGGVLVFPNVGLRDRVRHCGPTMIFSGPIQPPMLGAAIASAQKHLSPGFPRAQEQLAQLVDHTNERLARAGLPQVARTDTPLFFIPVGLPRIVYRLVKALMEDGCYVNLGIFPAVPMQQGGVRFTVHRNLRTEDIDHLVDRLSHHYFRVLAQEGSGLEAVKTAFRRVGLSTPPRPEREATDRKAEVHPVRLQVKHATSIREFDAPSWDAIFAGRGAMTHSALTMMEQVFTQCEDAMSRATPGYVWVTDNHGAVLAATMYNVLQIKEDMFCRAEVSRQLEAIRAQGQPDYLVSRALVLGTPLSTGEHLFLNRAHPQWSQALEALLQTLQRAKKDAAANQILLRDFGDGCDAELEARMLELGFFALRLPDSMQMTSLGWGDRDDYLSRLGQKYRYNVRKEVLAYEDRFELEASPTSDPRTIRQAYDLYCAVHRRSYQMNVFRLPFALFESMFGHPDYDVLRLYLKGPGATRTLAAVLVSHHAGGTYSALLVGLDDAALREHNSYKQILFRCVERARDLGAERLDLGFTAELEKKKLGARAFATRAYVQQDDDYAATVMETM